MDIIESLCKKYTDLSTEDIAIIRGMSAVLQPLANLEDADIFVDCPTADGDAIVVAEAKPESVPSSYKKTVVGLLAKPENEPAVARTLKLGIATKQMKAITQERTHVIQTVEPIRNGERVIGVLIREKREDEQRLVSERIHFSEQSYERIANAITHMSGENNWLPECIDEALIMVSHDGVVTFCNTLARELFVRLGFVEDLLGQKYDNICLIPKDTPEETVGPYTAVESQVGPYTLMIRQIRIDEEDIAFAEIVRDVTDFREQEKQLILKSVAIKEMHHRVKNNLQTIASLLRLQSRRASSEKTRQELTESMNRILSIAATHELLAQSGVDQVKIGEVINNIKSNAVRYFASSHFDVSILLEGDDFEVDSDIATSVALVVNELLQNSLKYAFPHKNSGEVRIVITEGDLYSRIEVIDNGCGFDIDKIDNDRLGLSIVKSLVKDKLRGNFTLTSGAGGTRTSFDFKRNVTEVINRIGTTQY